MVCCRVFLIGAGGLIVGYVLGRLSGARRAALGNNNGTKSERSATNSGSAVYDSTKVLQEYLQFHYAIPKELIPFKKEVMDNNLDFPVHVAQIVQKACPKGGRALDIGCAVGRTTYELCRTFKEAIGVDFSENFIKAALVLRTYGVMDYVSVEEGELQSFHTAKVPTDIDRTRSNFFVGDACNLDKSLGKFNAIVACNLMCRVPDPKKFLASVKDFLEPGGVFVLVSPYSWLAEYSKPSEWLGGTQETAHKNTSLIHAALGGESVFTLTHEEEVSFLLREHRRKYQLGVSHCLIWTRK
eukprot:PhF_6_TR22753/c0_g1_i1/m.32439